MGPGAGLGLLLGAALLRSPARVTVLYSLRRILVGRREKMERREKMRRAREAAAARKAALEARWGNNLSMWGGS